LVTEGHIGIYVHTGEEYCTMKQISTSFTTLTGSLPGKCCNSTDLFKKAHTSTYGVHLQASQLIGAG
jgi:hypothetical protein